MTPARAKSVLILVGPTGVGKTEVGFHVAVLLGGEIVSADSRLVYRGMDIGTAKPSAGMREEIPPDRCKIPDLNGAHSTGDISEE